MTIEIFSNSNITWDAAKEFASIQCDAFRDDQVTNAFIPEEERFNDHVLPSIADYAALRSRCDLFEKMVHSAARDTYIAVKSNPRNQLFLYRGPQGGFVAGAFWVLPKYLEVPPISFYARVKNFFLRRWFELKNYFAFYWVRNPFVALNVADFFKANSRKLGGEYTQERVEELENMNLSQLEQTTYPKDMCYYLRLLVVRSDQTKMGFGRSILKQSLKQLGPYEAPPTLQGPAKCSLISAPSARGFYSSIGLIVGASYERQLPNGEMSINQYFYGNLHATSKTKSG